jgi:hypothetical protein
MVRAATAFVKRMRQELGYHGSRDYGKLYSRMKRLNLVQKKHQTLLQNDRPHAYILSNLVCGLPVSPSSVFYTAD